MINKLMEKMKKSSLLPIAISAISFLSSGLSFSQTSWQCKPVEFAEMQTLDKEELKALYCKNFRGEKTSQQMQVMAEEAAIKMAKLGAVKESEQHSKDGRKHGNDAFACMTENSRVERLLQKQKITVNASQCE